MNALTAPTLADTVLWTARRFGYPPVEITMPGRMSPLQVAASADAWVRSVGLFRANEIVLTIMFEQLVAVDLELHRAVLTDGAVDA